MSFLREQLFYPLDFGFSVYFDFHGECCRESGDGQAGKRGNTRKVLKELGGKEETEDDVKLNKCQLR